MNNDLELNDIQFLNIGEEKEINAAFINKTWGKKINMIGIFKNIDTGHLFKVNIYKDFKHNKYGNRKDFRDIPFGATLKMLLRPKTSKNNNIYTKLIDYEIMTY